MGFPFSGIIVRYILSPSGTHSDTPATSEIGQHEETVGQPYRNVKDQLHINLWELDQRRLLDIGILIDRTTRLDCIQVDVPWRAQKDDVFDLGSRLDNEKILAAIFNDLVVYQGTNDIHPPLVKFPGSPDKTFVILRLNSFCFTIEHIVLSDGIVCTRIKIKFPATNYSIQDAPRAYIRFRISNIPEAVYTTKFLQKDRNLLSSSAETRIVDFRINVRRGVPDDVLAGNIDVIYPPWEKIHFFLTIDRVRELLFDGENFIACRSLEDEDIWNGYTATNRNNLEGSTSVTNYLAYQWSAKAKKETESSTLKPVKDMVALARFSYVTSSWLNLFRFLILALAVGAAGNGMWNIVEQLIAPYRSKEATEMSKNLITLSIFGTAIAILSFVSLRGTIRRLWFSYKYITKLWPKLKAYFRD